MAVTIKDVAERAGVSYTSVSRALNGKKGVGQETTARIISIAEEMGYRPNALARGLVNKRTYTLGLIIPDIINPFFPEIARGVDEAARKEGYNVFLCNTGWNLEQERRTIDLLAEKQVDGIITLPSHEGASVDYAKERLGEEIPIIYLSTLPKQSNVFSITVDNAHGTFLVAQHLVDRGYRKIGFIGGEATLTGVEDRLRGFQSALSGFGIDLPEEWIVNLGFGIGAGEEAIRRLLDLPHPPEAVFAENDYLALGVLQGLAERGIDVPGEMAVVGFDDIPVSALHGVNLTTVRQPKYRTGELAVRMLLDQLEGREEGAQVRKILLDPELVVRGTT